MVRVEFEGGHQHEAARDQRPGGDQRNEQDDRNTRECHDRNTEQDVDDPFKGQKAPAFALLGSVHRADHGKNAVDNGIGTEDENQRQHRDAGHEKGN